MHLSSESNGASCLPQLRLDPESLPNRSARGWVSAGPCHRGARSPDGGRAHADPSMASALRKRLGCENIFCPACRCCSCTTAVSCPTSSPNPSPWPAGGPTRSTGSRHGRAAKPSRRRLPAVFRGENFWMEWKFRPLFFPTPARCGQPCYPGPPPPFAGGALSMFLTSEATGSLALPRAPGAGPPLLNRRGVWDPAITEAISLGPAGRAPLRVSASPRARRGHPL